MKHSARQTILISFAFFSICAFWQIYDNLIPLMLENTFKLSTTTTNSIMAIDNVLALFLLPFFGSLSDKTKSKVGKRTPFIVFGTIVSAILMFLLPMATNIRSLPMFFIVLGLLLISMGTYRSPAVALMPDLTPKRHRSKANAIINLMGAVGGVYTLVAIMLLGKGKDPGYTNVFFSVSVLMLIAIIVLILTINENKIRRKLIEANEIEEEETDDELAQAGDAKLPKDVRKSLILILSSVFLWFCAYNAVITAYSRYATNFWHLEEGGFAAPLMLATIAAVVSYIPIGFIATKFGRIKTIKAGIIIMFVAYVLGYTVTTISPVIYIVLVLTGMGWAAINVNSYPMVVEMSKGSNIGKYTGFYYTFSMAAQIFTPILSGFFLQYIGLRTLFPYAAVFMILAFITFSFVKHGDAVQK